MERSSSRKLIKFDDCIKDFVSKSQRTHTHTLKCMPRKHISSIHAYMHTVVALLRSHTAHTHTHGRLAWISVGGTRAGRTRHNCRTESGSRRLHCVRTVMPDDDGTRTLRTGGPTVFSGAFCGRFIARIHSEIFLYGETWPPSLLDSIFVGFSPLLCARRRRRQSSLLAICFWSLYSYERG